MTWSRLDDDFWSHPKVLEAGNEAAGVYVRALSYCGCHGTDGHVSQEVARFIGRQRAFNRLLEAGLMERNGNGYLIPDFLDYNPSGEEAREKRAAVTKARREAGRLGGLATQANRKQEGKQSA